MSRCVKAERGKAGRERLGSDGSGKSRLGQACMVWKSNAGRERFDLDGRGG